jgi:hypothetical protein
MLVDILRAIGSAGFLAYHQEAESGRNMSGFEPSYDIHNDPLPVVLRSGLCWDRYRVFHLSMAVPMARVENKLEAALGSPLVRYHETIELRYLVLVPKAPTTNHSHLPNGHLPNGRPLLEAALGEDLLHY